jgi:uncharacterized protein YqeY
MIQEKIKDDMKKAMIAKDETRVLVLRGLMAAFTNELVSKMKKPNEPLADADAVAVIQRAIKQRKDSIEQFTKGGRKDLVKSEEKELKIIEEYSPKMMDKKDILVIAKKKKEEMKITDKAKAGMLMGAVIKELKGKADGGDVKEVVESLF